MFNRGDMMAIKMIFRDNMENYLRSTGQKDEDGNKLDTN